MQKATSLQHILFIIIILGAVCGNIICFQGDNSVTGTDAKNHLIFSIEFYYEISDIVKNEMLSVFNKVTDVIKIFSRPVRYSALFWPNAVNAGAAVCYFLFGISVFAAKLSLIPYLIILLLSA
ncbi:hypothetical protein ACFL3D_06895, partial [Candidatus Omnitrophota bacterium]